MKASDFRPEHFEKGRTFDRTDFDAYIRASEKQMKILTWGYLPSVAAGVLISQLFAKGIGGFVGNILALVCIFAGLLVGPILLMNAGKKTNEIARKLGITREDVAAARKHVKDGTLAWEPDEVPPEEEALRAAPESSTASVPTDKPARAIKAAAILGVLWLLLAFFHSCFLPNMRESCYALISLAAALLGTAVCLIIRKGPRGKAAAVGIGFAASLFLGSSFFVQLYVRPAGLKNYRFSLFFRFTYPPYVPTVLNMMFHAAVCLLIAFLLSLLLKKKRDKIKTVLCGLAAAVLYLVQPQNIIRILHKPGSYLKEEFLTDYLFPVLIGAVSLFAAAVAVSGLCSMERARVKLHGIGLVWCWIALLGSIAGIVFLVVWGISDRSAKIYERPYVLGLIIGLSSLIGYVLLLCGKRAGLYFILLGALMLGVQAAYGIHTVLIYLPRASSRQTAGGVSVILTSLLGALNPLFAWLSVRAGRSPE